MKSPRKVLPRPQSDLALFKTKSGQKVDYIGVSPLGETGTLSLCPDSEQFEVSDSYLGWRGTFVFPQTPLVGDIDRLQVLSDGDRKQGVISAVLRGISILGQLENGRHIVRRKKSEWWAQSLTDCLELVEHKTDDIPFQDATSQSTVTKARAASIAKPLKCLN